MIESVLTHDAHATVFEVDEAARSPDGQVAHAVEASADEFVAMLEAFEAATPAPEFGRLLPEGSYRGELIDAAFKRSPDKKTPYWDVRFKISEGRFRNRNLWYPIYFTAKNAANMRRDLTKLGIDRPTKSDLSFPSDKHFELTVLIETRTDGKQRNLVRSFIPVTE